MASLSVHFSSQSDNWATPWDLFRALDQRHGPCSLDVCATPDNAKVECFFSPKEDGLSRPWSGVCWMNPPYGRTIGSWVEKAYSEVLRGYAKKVICLLPSRTDTRWFHDFILPFAEIEFLKGRVKFGDGRNAAPFPSLVAVFSRRLSGGLDNS